MFSHIPNERGFRIRLPRSFVDRVTVFLWMWSFSFYQCHTDLSDVDTVRGWYAEAWTPVFTVSIYFKAPYWDSFSTLQTSLHIGWAPRKWWGIRDGELAMKYQWQRVWRRWLIEEKWDNPDNSGPTRPVRYLVEVQPM